MSSRSENSRSSSRSSTSSSSSSGYNKKKETRHKNETDKDKIELKKVSEEIKKIRVRVEGITKDVTKEHLLEIFGNFSEKLDIEFPQSDRKYSLRRHIIIEFYKEDDATQAILYMNGGQINGVEIQVSRVETDNNDNKRKNSNHRNRKFSEVSHDRNKKSDKGKDRKYEKSTKDRRDSYKQREKDNVSLFLTNNIGMIYFLNIIK